MNERLETARAQADHDMMDDTADYALGLRRMSPPKPTDAVRFESLQLANMLAEAVINDTTSQKARQAAARAVWLTRDDPDNHRIHVSMQFAHALYLCRQAAAQPPYADKVFSLPVLHDAAAQVVDHMSGSY